MMTLLWCAVKKMPNTQVAWSDSFLTCSVGVFPAQMRVALAQIVHEISRRFPIRKTNKILNQLITCSRGNLSNIALI